MTDRERWTIYPLLFLSLAMSLRDKLVRPGKIDVPQIRCRQLEVVNREGKPAITLGSSANQAGLLEVCGPDTAPRVVLATGGNNGGVVEVLGSHRNLVAMLASDPKAESGVITNFTGRKVPQVLLGSISGHGAITAFGPNGERLAELGSGPPWAGILALTDAEGKPLDLNKALLGGQISVLSADGKPQFVITHDDRGNGHALAVDSEGGVHLLLSAQLKVKPPGPPDVDGQPAVPANPEAPETTEPAENSTPEPEASSKQRGETPAAPASETPGPDASQSEGTADGDGAPPPAAPQPEQPE